MNDQNTDEKPVINLPAKNLPIKQITADEIESEIKKRMSSIDKEFAAGFDFIKTQNKSVTFFGGARFTAQNKYYVQAESLASKIAALDYSVISGGGPGIMEAANKGAKEAGGRSLGLTIKLPHEQARNPFLTDYQDFYYFFVRKVMLSFSAEAYVFFPGGFGTFDELFEILTLVQTNKIIKVPIFLVGSDYWLPLNNFMKENMYEKNETIDKQDMGLYTITDDENVILEAIKKAPIRNWDLLPDDYGL